MQNELRKKRETRAKTKAKTRTKLPHKSRVREMATTTTTTTSHMTLPHSNKQYAHTDAPKAHETTLIRLSLGLVQTYANCSQPQQSWNETPIEAQVSEFSSAAAPSLMHNHNDHDEWTWEEEEEEEEEAESGLREDKDWNSYSDTLTAPSAPATTAGIDTAHHKKTRNKASVNGSSCTHKSRRVLTKNSSPYGNNGRDNDEWNLIVHVRDVLSNGSHNKQYVVLDILGQGTFGQVFRCQNVTTKEIVAVKVIRNHPSYHKQATIEVQLLDMLNQRYLRRRRRHGASDERLSTKTSDPVPVRDNNNQQEEDEALGDDLEPPVDDVPIVELQDVFVFHNHLCLVFEQLSLNLYELIAQNDFHGFPLAVTRGFLIQILGALVLLEESNVIHCDLKPENVLLVGSNKLFNECSWDSSARSRCQSSSSTGSSTSASSYGSIDPFDEVQRGRNDPQTPLIKVIDFGSACMEKETVYSYIQSRFYRSPEVLLGMDYTRAIDMWSLGCIAVEMFLGLPLFPGVSEHDQLRLITCTLGKFPPHLLHNGKNVRKYFNICHSIGGQQEFVLKSAEAYAKENQTEVQMSKKYFKHSKLEEMIYACPSDECVDSEEDEKQARSMFLHFVKGLLELDPHKRWTAKEAIKHPFITGKRRIVSDSNGIFSTLERTQKLAPAGRIELRDRPLWQHIQHLFHPYHRLVGKEANCLVTSNCACSSIESNAAASVAGLNGASANTSHHVLRHPPLSHSSEPSISCSCQRSATWCSSDSDWNYDTFLDKGSAVQGAAESVLRATANLLCSDFPSYQQQLQRTIYTIKSHAPMESSPPTLVSVVPTFQDESGSWQVQQISQYSQPAHLSQARQLWGYHQPEPSDQPQQSNFDSHGSQQNESDGAGQKKVMVSELDPNVRPFVPSQSFAEVQEWDAVNKYNNNDHDHHANSCGPLHTPQANQHNQQKDRRRNHRYHHHHHQHQHHRHHSHHSHTTPRRSRPRRSTHQRSQRSENCAEDFASVEQRFSMAMQLDGIKSMPLPT